MKDEDLKFLQRHTVEELKIQREHNAEVELEKEAIIKKMNVMVTALVEIHKILTPLAIAWEEADRVLHPERWNFEEEEGETKKS
jgi:FKBP-type peptidyl-prolyl cis-trans isomerase (trigger factor)